jgi:hypothetical protein
MFQVGLMTAEDLTIIEQAGRRCSGCHSGRHWRRLEVLRTEGHDPLVTCPGCRPRLMAKASAQPPPAQPPPSTAPSAPARPRRPRHAAPRQREDRLKRALRNLPAGAHSTERIAKAAGLNQTKVLSRLQAMEAAGEVQRVGKRWSTQRPSTDLEAAFDRLQARTSNLRIIRPANAARS